MTADNKPALPPLPAHLAEARIDGALVYLVHSDDQMRAYGQACWDAAIAAAAKHLDESDKSKHPSDSADEIRGFSRTFGLAHDIKASQEMHRAMLDAHNGGLGIIRVSRVDPDEFSAKLPDSSVMPNAQQSVQRHDSGVIAQEAQAGGNPWRALADKAVTVLQRHAPPNGLSDQDALTELYGIFDGPEYRAALASRLPVREPITDDAIMMIARQEGMATYDCTLNPMEYAIDYARAIEAAHGIATATGSKEAT